MNSFTTCLVLLGPLALCASAAQGAPGVGDGAHKPGKAPAKSPITIAPPLPGSFLGGSDSCATPVPIIGNGTWPFDLTTATTGTQGQNETLCAGTGGPGITFDVWYVWTATGTGTATLDTCMQTTVDTKVAVYPGNACPVDGTAIACNDDTCITQSEISWAAASGTTYMIQIGTWPHAQQGTGTFEITAMTGPPGTVYCSCNNSGPCGNNGAQGNGCANGSFGDGAHLTASGLPSATNDSLVLEVTHATPSQPGLFFQGENAINGGNGVPFGDGLRCAGMNVIRLQVVVANPSGAAQTSVPIAAGGGVSSGDIRHYQFWYRDPQLSLCGSLFNLSNGFTVHWL